MYILCNRFKIIKIIISIYACSCVLLGFVSIGWTGNGSFSKVCFITRHKPNVQGKDLLDSFIQWYMDGSYIVDLHTGLMHLIQCNNYCSSWIFSWMRRIYWPGFRMAGRNTMSMCLWRPTWSPPFRGNKAPKIGLALQVI